MSVKQDRTAARTVTDIERKYSFGKSFAEVMGIATDAQKTAGQANEAAKECHTEIIKLADSITLKVTGGEVGNTASIVLTVGDEEYSGKINLQGLVTFSSLENEGEATINGGNMTIGAIRSADGSVVFDLDNGRIIVTTEDSTFKTLLSVYGLTLHGLNALTQNYDRTLVITPGRITGTGTSETANIIAMNGCSLCLDAPGGGRVYVGSPAASVITGPLNPGKATLFTGDVAKGGTFTVPNTEFYDLFAIKVSVASAEKPGVILAYKDGNTIHGMGGWGGDSATRKETYWVSIEFEDDTWTLVHGSCHDVSLATGAWSAGTEIKVLEVIGVI